MIQGKTQTPSNMELNCFTTTKNQIENQTALKRSKNVLKLFVKFMQQMLPNQNESFIVLLYQENSKVEHLFSIMMNVCVLFN